MANVMEGLKPEGVWKYFAEIARIPRGSKNEAAISRYVLETARKLGLKAKADAVGNVIVAKPASTGREDARPICLQGHMDMVCEKSIDKKHDFLKDPIEIVRKEGFLMANGTTLGADNGIGVATNLAVMEDRTLQHGPLELLFTVDEETGLTGANSLQPDFVTCRTLINLDSEEEGALFVGCSGGKDTVGVWNLETDPAPRSSTAVAVRVRGLKGGHSGLEIDKGRGNALKIMNRVLVCLGDFGARISSINGGNKRNAIPRDADAILFLPENKLREAGDALARLATTLKKEIASVDPELSITLEPQKVRKGKVLKRSLQKKLLQTMIALPHGVIKMSADIPELVETSTNLAIIQTNRKDILIATSQRSSVASEIIEMAQVVKTIFEMGGAATRCGDGYPGWTPNLSSQLLKVAKAAYQGLFRKEPEVKAIHAGLECGIIGEKYPGMDMISFGPTLSGVHTPDEKILISSVERYWSFLLKILSTRF
jgi:dipeptidase D